MYSILVITSLLGTSNIRISIVGFDVFKRVALKMFSKNRRCLFNDYRSLYFRNNSFVLYVIIRREYVANLR